MNGFCLARNLWALGQLIPNRLFSIVNEKSLSIQLKTERTHFGQGQEKWVVCIIQAQLQTNTYYVSFQSSHQKMNQRIMMMNVKNFPEIRKTTRILATNFTNTLNLSMIKHTNLRLRDLPNSSMNSATLHLHILPIYALINMNLHKATNNKFLLIAKDWHNCKLQLA